MKSLVVYFSHVGQNWIGGGIVNLVKGNTEVIAEYIRDIIGADIFKIETENEYPKNYDECVSIAKTELGANARPVLKNLPGNDLDEYDTVFIGGPVWWGTYPMAIFTFCDRYNWAGKKIMPFVTHEGSGLAECVEDIKKIAVGAEVGAGLAVYGSNVADARAMVEEWVKKN